MEYELLLLNLTRNVDKRASYFQECIGQHLIAAYLAEHGFRAKVYAGDILQGRQIIRHEMESHGIRYIGFYVGADNVVMIGNLIRWLKRTDSMVTLVGGPEAAALGRKFLKDTGCDFIIAGEGERPILALLSYLEKGIGQLEQIKGLRCLKKDGTFHAAPQDDLVTELDKMPFPRREDSLSRRFRRGRAIGILTGRGCPFHCSFCYEGAVSKTVRLRSIGNVMEEIDQVRGSNPNLESVNVFDDTFTLNTERVYEFCRNMKQRGLAWTCEGHVSCLYQHPEMIEVMVDSGLTAMQIGIESGSRRVLDAYQKRITPEMIIETVRRCYHAGLASLAGNYIIGGAFESDETLEESLKHAKSLISEGRGMVELNTVFFAPYHGTPITKCPENYGMRLIPERIAEKITTMTEPVSETQGLSVEEIIKWRQTFDQQLREHYLLQAALCTKKDLFRKKLGNKRENVLNRKWYEAWIQIPHLEEFLQHSAIEEQMYMPEKYPLHTGIARKTGEGFVDVDGVTLTGIRSDAWHWADGRHTVAQLARMRGIPLEMLGNVYCELNHFCFVYFSDF
ncbi:MAG: radical SAM protein [Lachnospiraceae bacterium]|jgi:anaerobic magnesium-protoporphyrin IX monomethyl ester cyclase|nr:radical SAM protein [Lachnospiraceae bacterium]